jgi:hypothetical protein
LSPSLQGHISRDNQVEMDMAATAKRLRTRRSATSTSASTSASTVHKAADAAVAKVESLAEHGLPEPPEPPTSGKLADWHRAFDMQRKLLNQLSQMVHSQAEALRARQEAIDAEHEKQRRLVRQKTMEVRAGSGFLCLRRCPRTPFGPTPPFTTKYRTIQVAQLRSQIEELQFLEEQHRRASDGLETLKVSD